MTKKISYYICAIFFCAAILFFILAPQKVQAAETTSTLILKVRNNSDITTALKNAMEPNTTIIVPDGSYTVSDQIRLEPGVTIKAQKSAVKITSTKSVSYMFFTPNQTSGTTISDITLENLYLDGEHLTSAVLRFSDTTDIQLLNITAAGGTGSNTCGVRLVDSKAVIKNSTFSENGRNGIDIQSESNSSTLNISDSEFTANKNCGINLSGKNVTVSISGSTISSNSGHGIAVYNGAHLNSCSSSTINSNKENGLYISGSNTKAASLKNCKISGNQHGIALSGAKMSVSNTLVTGNKQNGINVAAKSVISISGSKSEVTGNKNNGISVSNGSTGSFSGFDVDSNYNHGITCSGSSTVKAIYMEINENGHSVNYNKNGIKYTSEGNGINITDRSKGIVQQCTISKNKGHGVSIGNSTVNMESIKSAKNKIYKNAWNGISITGKYSTVSVKYTDCTYNGTAPKETSEGENGHGIGVFENSTAAISGCNLNNNAVCGLSPFSSKVTVSSSNINYNGRHGIGGRSKVTLSSSNNVVKGNKAHGIMLIDSSTGTIKNNTISGNGQYGLDLGNTTKAIKVYSTTSNSNKKSGIFIYKATNVSLSSVTANSNSQYGMTIRENSKVNLSGGNYSSNKMQGIYMTGNKYTSSINKATISGNKKEGIAVTNARASITGCSINNNYNYGIKIYNKSNISKIQSNTIASNKQYGIYSNGSSISSMTGNKITGHTKYGIVLYSKSKAPSIKNNTLSNPSGKYEFYKDSKSTSNLKTLKKVSVSRVKPNATSIKGTAEYSCAMKSHFRKFGNQMSGSGNHLCNYASLLA